MPDVVAKETTITTGTPSSNANSSQKPVAEADKAESSQTVAYVVYFLLGAVEILFLFRLIFKITGANPTSGFVSMIYSLSQIFILPFSGIFPQSTTTGAVTTAIFEPAILVAMAVYAVLAWGIIQIIGIMSRKVQ